MSHKSTPKIQPWKNMKSMDENTDPDFGKLSNFMHTEPTCGSSGASVRKPIQQKQQKVEDAGQDVKDAVGTGSPEQ